MNTSFHPPPITCFRDEYEFLSNFYTHQITCEGMTFYSVESAFQSFKCLSKEDRAQFQYLSPAKAKRRGRQVELRPDWEERKLGYMSSLVRLKFETRSDLQHKLLATGDAELIEGNTWHDNFWGNCDCAKCRNIKGANHLGKILMEVREALRVSQDDTGGFMDGAD